MRGRIRTIKPEIFSDEKLWDLGVESGLPVLQAFQGLWCFADRDGRFEWRPRALKNLILPYWQGDFAQILTALEAGRFIVRYSVDGREFAYIRTWAKHQVINNREAPSDIPAPGDEHAPEPKATGFVYVAAVKGGAAFKVGFALHRPDRRVSDLSTGSPDPLELVDFIEGPAALEKEIHQALAAHRKHREWFHVSPESCAVLEAWFTRAPRDLHAGKAEGKGMEGNGREREGEDARPLLAGGVSRTYTMPSAEPPKEFLDVALMGGVSAAQATSTWKHYRGAGLPPSGVERLFDWLTQRAAERATQLARLPQQRPGGSKGITATLEPTGRHMAYAKKHGLPIDDLVRELVRSGAVDDLGAKRALELLGEKMSQLVRERQHAAA